jgi:ABC-type phosphate transport system substrate-binding protein
MMAKIMRKLLPLLLVLSAGEAIADGVVVIGHSTLPKLDTVTIQKLFTGRIIEIDGMPVTVVNLTRGHSVRGNFLAAFLGQDEDKYRAYWTVRQFIGKGTPPRDLASSREVVDFVQSQPGAIGYIDPADLRPGLNVLSRK